jgi:hypothetical protein
MLRRSVMNVSWVKCGNEANWCPLENVNLDDVDTFGVYIIWHEGNPGQVVRLGQGDVKSRLCVHRTDRQILAYNRKGILRVTWAAVPWNQVDGVERYLADNWPPLIGSAFPDALPIAVNSPWS